jgi:hypothetical protein
MTLGNCPLCGSLVRAKGVKPYSRLTCSKCHADLHLRKDGGLAIGDPPDVDQQFQELKREVRQLARQFPTRKVATVVAVLLVLGLGSYQLFGPAERLDSVAEKAAQAIANDDPKALESLAAPGTTDDLRRWYDAVHPKLVQFREQWGAKSEAVEARVAQEDRDQHRGAVSVSIHPILSGARDVSLADPAQATAAAAVPFEQATDWTLTRWGRWKLDGRATNARLSPTTVAR